MYSSSSIAATTGTREFGRYRGVAITQGSYKPHPPDKSVENSSVSVCTKAHVDTVKRKCTVVCSLWPQTTTTMRCFKASHHMCNAETP